MPFHVFSPKVNLIILLTDPALLIQVSLLGLTISNNLICHFLFFSPWYAQSGLRNLIIFYFEPFVRQRRVQVFVSKEYLLTVTLGSRNDPHQRFCTSHLDSVPRIYLRSKLG